MAYYDDDLEECRICFDVETEKNKFISPCRCSGTSQYVHIKCSLVQILAMTQQSGYFL